MTHFLAQCGPWAMEPRALESLAAVALAGDPERAAKLLTALFEPAAAVRKVAGGGGKNIAVLQVSGVMMKQPSWVGGTSTLQLRQDLRDAVADPDVGAILLNIDSPGGSVAGMADLAAETKAASRQKPVWAQVHDLAASAAYWLASQTGRIVANSDMTMVGSIGVYNGPFFDVSEMLAKEGVKAFFPTSGPLKGAFTQGPPITDAQKAYANEITAHVFDQFKAAVAKARNLGAKAMDSVTHGGIMPAPQALDAGLIDAIRPASKTLDELSAAMKGGLKINPSSGRSGAIFPMVRQVTLPVVSGR